MNRRIWYISHDFAGSRFIDDEAEESSAEDSNGSGDSFIVSDHFSDTSSVLQEVRSVCRSLRNRRHFTNAHCATCQRFWRIILRLLSDINALGL
jgi:hypothetical protein